MGLNMGKAKETDITKTRVNKTTIRIIIFQNSKQNKQITTVKDGRHRR
jgi:hypothetical protein